MSLEGTGPGPQEPEQAAQPGQQPEPSAGPEPNRRSVPNMRRVTDAATLRALSHPVRIALIEALFLGGSMTATELGERIGETPTTCSFHLRQLAKFGWVEEAGGGKGRARPWRMTSVGFETPSTHVNREADVASGVLISMFRERALDRYRTWLQHRTTYPTPWRKAATDSEYFYYLTVEELAQLSQELNDVLSRWHYAERITDPSTRPAGSVPVELLAFAYPVDFPPDSDEQAGTDSGAPGAGDPSQDEDAPGDPA